MRRKLETSGEVVRVEFPALNVGTSAFPFNLVKLSCGIRAKIPSGRKK